MAARDRRSRFERTCFLASFSALTQCRCFQWSTAILRRRSREPAHRNPAWCLRTTPRGSFACSRKSTPDWTCSIEKANLIQFNSFRNCQFQFEIFKLTEIHLYSNLNQFRYSRAPTWDLFRRCEWRSSITATSLRFRPIKFSRNKNVKRDDAWGR